ncbi:MAG: hypothetical protein QM740_19850 [Acidovorax sp.]
MNDDTSKHPIPESPFPATKDNNHEKASASDASKPPVVDRLEHAAQQTVKQLADNASTHIKQVQQTIARANDGVQQTAQAWKTAGDEWVECLRVTVRENPLTAVATALAAGLLIGRLGHPNR